MRSIPKKNIFKTTRILTLLLVPLGPLEDRAQLQPSALQWILTAYYAEAMVFYIINLLEKRKNTHTTSTSLQVLTS